MLTLLTKQKNKRLFSKDEAPCHVSEGLWCDSMYPETLPLGGGQDHPRGGRKQGATEKELFCFLL